MRLGLRTLAQMDTLLVTIRIPDAQLDKMRQAFKSVHYYPDNAPIPPEALETAEMLFTSGARFASSIKSLDGLPKLKHIQMGSAGANGILGTAQMKEYLEKQRAREITLAGASGTHVLSIPNYVVAMIITLYHQLHTQIIVARVSLCGHLSASALSRLHFLLTARPRRSG
jgi:lactate dehydrogenase-like 2-hydroxyacid dehydrogenase